MTIQRPHRPLRALSRALIFAALLALVPLQGCSSTARDPESLKSQEAPVAAQAGRAPASSGAGSDRFSQVPRDVLRYPPGWVNLSGKDSNKVSKKVSDLVAPQSLPAPDEELWIIEKPAAGQPAQPADDVPGSGALMTRRPGSDQPVPIPLAHTDVRADVAGFIATTTVRQTYRNPFDGKIEALYVFPLPQDAAVNEFLMTVGPRTIRGVIRERAEAEQIYKEAKAAGQVASLLTQERPNVFTQAVANIEPGKQIDITIRYFGTLAWADGGYEYVFPMVVGPRFNPPGSTDGIGAVGSDFAKPQAASGQAVNVPYLKPGQRSGHDISLVVNIDAGVPIEAVSARDHQISVDRPEKGLVRVTLAPEDAIPNKDFVLRYKVVGQKTRTAMMVQPDKDGPGGYFALMLFPPADQADLPETPLELVFTLDVSGSMSGQPLDQSKAAVRYALNRLRPADTFNIVRFASGADRMARRPVPATPANVREGLKFLDGTESGGGTMMEQGVNQSLAGPFDPNRVRFVSFLTDGFIGNEADILRAIRAADAPAKIFSVGVGSSPNRFLMDRMAKFGGGAGAYLGLQDSGDDLMKGFLDVVRRPALTNVALDFGGATVSDVYPAKLPDLFVNRPITVVGRYSNAMPTNVTIRGRTGGEQRSLPVAVDAGRRHGGIETVWARREIADLADRSIYETGTDLPAAIRTVALEHNLMSAYTAFVAVDSMSKTPGDHGVTVAVPVPVPDGVRYDTTVSE